MTADLVSRQIALARVLRERARVYPADTYRPHAVSLRGPRKGKPSGQLQFHRAPHPFRIAAPGNGWGGTMACACEADAWARGTNRWQVTPPPPVLMLWFGPLKAQIAMIRETMLQPKVFGPRVKLRHDDMGTFFLWPNNSKMYISSYETAWSAFEGIEPALVVFDEQPPRALALEMGQRRRGKGINKARFICKATQSKGLSWMAQEIYEPWKKHHLKLGFDEEGAMRVQKHPYYWLWPTGSIHDNPHMDEETVREYEERIWPSAKERKVRLYGGFESFFGDSVFDPESVEWYRMMQEHFDELYGAGQDGFFVPLEARPRAHR